MSIRLNAYKNYGAGMAQAVSDKKTLPKGASAGSAASKTDTVSISANAAEYSAAKVRSEVSAQVNALSGSDRLAGIKAQIAGGEYAVSSEDLAGRILERFA
ncbi:MAG: flagellar biosynthesis anti-sigma factor FlgM [Oscillospiraceae bacterium]